MSVPTDAKYKNEDIEKLVCMNAYQWLQKYTSSTAVVIEHGSNIATEYIM
jgi:hypothetical protein